MKTIDVYVLMAEVNLFNTVIKLVTDENIAKEWEDGIYWYVKKELTFPQEIQVQRDY